MADGITLVDEFVELFWGKSADPSKFFADGGGFSVAVSVWGFKQPALEIEGSDAMFKKAGRLAQIELSSEGGVR